MESENSDTFENMELETEVTDFILNNSYLNNNNRFVMAIPWISRLKCKLGTNDKLAYSVLKSVCKKYNSNLNTLLDIDKVFQDQLNENIISRIYDRGI
jgi:hypothetical protein